MTVNSTFYYITGGKGSASFVCEIGLNRFEYRIMLEIL